MKTISLIFKFLSVITGLAAYANIIPAKYAPLAVLVFAIASTLKDLVVKIGDWIDDGQLNGSFTPDKPSSNGSASKLPLILLAALLALPLVFSAGCIATNPAHATDPTAPAYVIDSRLTNNLATAQTVSAVAAPLVAAVVPAAAPLVPFVPSIVDVIGSLLLLASGGFAWYKNRQAAQQTAAAAALAATIPISSHPAALANAATNGSTAAVATALAGSQSPT